MKFWLTEFFLEHFKNAIPGWGVWLSGGALPDMHKGLGATPAPQTQSSWPPGLQPSSPCPPDTTRPHTLGLLTFSLVLFLADLTKCFGVAVCVRSLEPLRLSHLWVLSLRQVWNVWTPASLCVSCAFTSLLSWPPVRTVLG